MDFIADQATQRLVDKLVPRQWSHAVKFTRDDYGFEMRVVIACDPDDRVIEARFDEPGDFIWIHKLSKKGFAFGRAGTGKAQAFPTSGADCVSYSAPIRVRSNIC